MARPPPLAPVRAFSSSVLATVVLLARGALRLPKDRVGHAVSFEDGSRSQVFRETVRTGAVTRDPAFLAVAFRLRLVGRSRLLHALFRAESVANTLLFAGFPGFRSKLWLTDQDSGWYRGLYEWDGAERAHRYATTLSLLLRPACEPGSVTFHVIPGVGRDDALRTPSLLLAAGDDSAPPAWWRPVPEEGS
jgi:hypothetical protein